VIEASNRRENRIAFLDGARDDLGTIGTQLAIARQLPSASYLLPRLEALEHQLRQGRPLDDDQRMQISMSVMEIEALLAES
jgi:hypothetical protein